MNARLNRVLAELFDLIIALDVPETRMANSVSDMASWLGFDVGVEAGTARAWVRVAHGLADLPAIRSAFLSGTVSFDEVKILCRFATEDNERELLALTRETLIGDLARVIRDHLGIESAPRPRDERRPYLEMGWNESETRLRLRGEIPGVDGLMVETALRRVASQAPLDETTGLHRSCEETQGEALVQIASEAAAADRDHDRATLVVHFNAADAAAGRASGMVGERLIDRDDFLRLSCDARLQPAIDDPSGVTVGVGRTTRTIPPWLRRLVDGRDDGCRFPGCARTRWTHVHHLMHWADGGPTNLDNLLTLCGFHHRLIHKKRWEILGNPNGDVIFTNQWGEEHKPARDHLGPGHVQHLLSYDDHYHSYRLGRLATANGPP